MKVPDRLRVVGAETEVEVCAGGEDEEELWEECAEDDSWADEVDEEFEQ